MKEVKPLLRFKHDNGSTFPNWKIIKLKDLAKRNSVKNKNELVTRVLTNSAVEGVLDQRDYFDKDIAVQGNLQGYYIVEEGDYVYNPRVSIAAPVGPISKNKIGKGVMSPLYTVFRFNNKNNDFFDYFFKSSKWYRYLQTISNTGARHDRMSISAKDFFSMPIPVPNEEEQKKITECLSLLDKLITCESQKLKCFYLHKKGLVQNLFPVHGEVMPKLRFQEFENMAEWESGELKDISTMQAGKFVRASDISDRNDSCLYPCYGGNGLRGYTKTYNHDGKYSLIGRQGALCGNVRLAQGKFHATEHAVVVTPKEAVTTDWLYYKLEHLNLNRFATGQAQPGLSVENLNKVPVSVPPSKQEQQKISDCLNSIAELISAQERKVKRLMLHKKGLLQELFPSIDGVS